ncbi:MAG: PQQ-binding-like beta-propeller repeat protein [Candidatus Omnitrophota bacterium]
MPRPYWRGIVLSFFVLRIPLFGFGADWPAWRFDANRSADSPQELPASLSLLWTRDYPPLDPVWDDPLNRDLMQYDKVYEPIVLGKTLLVGSNAWDCLTALDADSGDEKWTFYANGPVRFPAAAGNGKVYFVSDDGRLYCLGAEDGRMIWKYDGAPYDRKILGNERLISTWPARGGPALKDGIVYFAAGIWPFMGVFVYALNAETGREIWVNDSSSFLFINQPHNSPSFAGVAPQGNLVVAGDKLLVPCGRSVPACFDLKTGKFLYYHLARNQRNGGAFVCALGDQFFNYHRDLTVNAFDLTTGEMLVKEFGKIPVLTRKAIYCMGETIAAFDPNKINIIETKQIVKDEDKEEDKIVIKKTPEFAKLWEYSADASGDLIKAGNYLYAGGKNIVSAIRLDGGKASTVWQTKIDGTAARLIAADGKLFVATLEGRLYAFGENAETAKIHPYAPLPITIADSIHEKAKTILNASAIRDGYCLVYGNGELAAALAMNSTLRAILAEPDQEKAKQWREQFVKAGLYGKNLSVYEGSPLTLNLPPYLASLFVVDGTYALEAEKNPDLLHKIYSTLRPYGGIFCFMASQEEHAKIIDRIQSCQLPNAKIVESDNCVLLQRDGALPGAADWTHQYGDIANTLKSDDRLVEAPLGLLWFGGSSNMDVLPRHGHGPPEQVIGGRLFIEGIDRLNARDVYTGRVLWKRLLPQLNNFGVYYDETYKDTPLETDYNQIHLPGANARGTNYAAAADAVYILHGTGCLALDPVTGETLREIYLPIPDKSPPKWGYIGVYKDYLIAGAESLSYMDYLGSLSEEAAKKKPFFNFDISSSKRLIVMNRYTGAKIWNFDSNLGLRHNAIAAGNDKLFCIDKMPENVSAALKRRGRRIPATSRLLAFDIRNGNILWSLTENIDGTWLSYSEERDILLQSGRKSRDSLADESSEGMTAYRGADGQFLWSNNAVFSGPCILHSDDIITDGTAYSLLSGKRKQAKNPLTGEVTSWMLRRNYGCNYPIACENLLTFRSAAAGFYDLMRDGGTGNLGGFKSSCTSNLVAANGVLNAPDYTRTCTCSYQNQTSLAMIRDPGVEYWTFNSFELGDAPIRRLGVNFGAPGDRRADDGVLWLEYPFVGGPSLKIKIRTEPKNPEWFQHHSSRLQGGDLRWVAASGAKGLRRIVLTLTEKPQPPRNYAVRLIFMEPDDLAPGERIMNVSIQGKRVLTDFDIAKEAGSSRWGIAKEFKNITADKDFSIELAPGGPNPQNETVLCGFEIINEEDNI